MNILIAISFLAAVLPALLLLRNLCIFSCPKASDATRISILIPARNEESNIAAAVRCALANSGAEVLVLDDHSSDRTSEIVLQLALSEPRLRLVRGKNLPEGWAGKNFACAQLAEAASTPLLLFLDADVRLMPNGAGRMARALRETGADLISGVPRQETVTFSEILLLPLIQFILLAFLPLDAMRRSAHSRYATGCGQLMMVRASVYRESGGHAAIRSSLHDGLTLPKQFRVAGFRTELIDGTDLAVCRMYGDNRSVWLGLTKAAHQGLGAPARIVPISLLLLAGQVLPFVFLFLVRPWSLGFVTVVIALGMVISARLVCARRCRQSYASMFLHPIAILSLLFIQWCGLVRYLQKLPSTWKGRSYFPATAGT